MHYSLAIALRYLRARRRSGFVSRVTMIAVGGTLVGVAVLITVLSLMNGFESELRGRIIEFNTHVIVFASLPEFSPRRTSSGPIARASEEAKNGSGRDSTTTTGGLPWSAADSYPAASGCRAKRNRRSTPKAFRWLPSAG